MLIVLKFLGKFIYEQQTLEMAGELIVSLLDVTLRQVEKWQTIPLMISSICSPTLHILIFILKLEIILKLLDDINFRAFPPPCLFPNSSS